MQLPAIRTTRSSMWKPSTQSQSQKTRTNQPIHNRFGFLLCFADLEFWNEGGLTQYPRQNLTLVRSFHAGMPLFVFGVNVTEPQITLNAVNGSGKIARWFSCRNSLACPVGRFLVVGGSLHQCTSCRDCTLI